MTDETKKLFDAPWYVEVTEYNETIFCVLDNGGCYIATNVICKRDANRIDRLPELYDALVEACGEYCPELKHDIDHCGNCGGENCKATEWVELLRKVRDGK